jgi:small GTP-binding protein
MEKEVMPIFTSQKVDSSGDYGRLLKLIIVGDTAVGKSSILQRFCDGTFHDSFMSTIGVDFKFKLIDATSGERVKLQIWDTCGQERFNTITNAFFRGSNGVILVYDCTNTSSLAKLDYWYQQATKLCPNAEIVVVANKIDLDRKISTEDGKAWAVARNAGFFIETSAKLDENISQLFVQLTDRLRPKNLDCYDYTETDMLVLGHNGGRTNFCC